MKTIALPSTFSTNSLHALASLIVMVLPLALLLGRGGTDVLMCIATVFFLIHSVRQRDFRWMQERWIQFAFAAWIYISLRGIWTEFPSDSVGRAAGWIRYPLFAAALGSWILKDREVRNWLLYSVSACLLFILFDSLLQFFTGYDIVRKPYILDDEKLRLTGPFGTPIVGVMLVTLAFPVCMWAMVERGGNLRSAPAFLRGFALSVLVLATVLLSGERTALVLCLLGFGLMFILIPMRLLYKASLLASAAMVMGLLLFSNPLVMQRQIHSLTTVVSNFTNSTYGEIWGSAARMFEVNPVFGIGVRQFRIECPKSIYGPAENVASRCGYHPHNTYLELLSETGLVGFSLFAGCFALLFARWIRAYPHLKTDPIFLGLLITLCVRLFPFAPLTSFYINWYAIPLWLFVGWLIALTDPNEKPQGNP